MERYDKWLPEKAENRKALRLFGLTALVLLLLLLANALYVVYGTRYSEYAVTKDVTIELLKDDGSSEIASPEQVFPDGSRVRIHVPLPSRNPSHQYTLAFTTVRAYSRVLWNEKVLDSYDESHVSRSHNFGAVPMLVELPGESMGSAVTIEEELLSHNPQLYLGDILVIPTKKSYSYFLSDEGFLFTIYHTLLLISLLAVLILLFFKKTPTVKKGLSIALFVASFDLWSLGYHHMLGFWIRNPYIDSLLEYGALYFLPAPFLCYLSLSETDKSRKNVGRLLAAGFLILFIFASISQAAGLFTLDDLLPILHIFILTAGIFICFQLLHPRKEEKIWNVLVRWDIFISSGAAALVILQYYFANSQSLLTFRFMQALSTWALLIFIFSVTLSFCCQLLSQYEEAQEKKAALHLAFHDSLTGLLNHAGIFRTAEKLDPKKPYSLLFLDLNGLKEVNDLQGHEKGDTFLRRMADILRKTTGKEAHCGRFGGDEFVVILPEKKEEELQQMIQNISRRLSTLKGKPGMPKDPSASFGWSIHTPSQNTSFEEHLKEADDRMYQAKEAYRKSHPLEAGRVFTREK